MPEPESWDPPFSPQQHYRMADRLIRQAAASRSQAQTAYLLQAAQIHATLAQTPEPTWRRAELEGDRVRVG